ncbi:hypothetical protein KAR91_09850 [Candidatus Pacearchaeota archaeon]|nr:hypothetical protein [Candidatus Pacearchaeota archaeon]
MIEEGKIKSGDKITISGVGVNKSGDIIRRIKNDNKRPPFWGINIRTEKRGKAVKLAELIAQ